MKYTQKSRRSAADHVTFSVLQSSSTDSRLLPADIFARQGVLMMYLAFVISLMLLAPQPFFSQHSVGTLIAGLLCIQLATHQFEYNRFSARVHKLIINLLALIFIGLLILLSIWESTAAAVLLLPFNFWLYHRSQWRLRATALISVIVSLICLLPNLAKGSLIPYFGWLTLLVTAQLVSLLILKHREKISEQHSGKVNPLEQETERDQLTGLLNRQRVLELGQCELQRADRQKQPLTLILSHFRGLQSIPDEYRLEAQNQILKDVSKTLVPIFRASDLLGRFNDNELIIVLPNANLAAARKLAKRLSCAINQLRISDRESDPNGSLDIESCMGVVTIEVGAQMAIGELTSLARDALLYAKNNGRHKTAFQLVECC